MKVKQEVERNMDDRINKLIIKTKFTLFVTILYQLIGAVGETIGNQMKYMLLGLIKSKVNLYSMNRMLNSCTHVGLHWFTINITIKGFMW